MSTLVLNELLLSGPAIGRPGSAVSSPSRRSQSDLLMDQLSLGAPSATGMFSLVEPASVSERVETR
jgi:hypothetical protein